MFNSIHKSFKMLFPLSVGVEDNESQEHSEAILDDLGEDGPAAKKKIKRASHKRVADLKDAVKSRLPSTWTDKENVNTNIDMKVAANNKETHMPNKAVAEPPMRKISLSKLNASADLFPYDCASANEMLIMGQKRMFFVLKSKDDLHTGMVMWIQSYHDIHSCTITFDTITEGGTDVSLDILSSKSIRRKVRMPDPVICAKILELIREKKQVYENEFHSY